MSAPLIQSAVVLPQGSTLPWREASVPGANLTVPVFGKTVDIQGYATRDHELQYRDVVLAVAIEKILRHLNTIWNTNLSYLSIPKAGAIEIKATVSAQSQGTGSDTIQLAAPIKPSSVAVVLGATTAYDDGKGRIIPNGSISCGAIDYQTGILTVTTNPVTRAAFSVTSFTYSFLQNATGSPDFDSGSTVTEGPTGVRYVNNSSVPRDAQTTDKDLYRRDLILYSVLSQAVSALQNVPYGQAFQDLVADFILPVPSAVTIAIGQEWSQAAASNNTAEVGFNLPYNTQLYTNPDTELAYRDNILAYYASLISNILNNTSQANIVSLNFVTESGADLLSEDGQILFPEDEIDAIVNTGTCSYYDYANKVCIRISDAATLQDGLLTDLGDIIETDDGQDIIITAGTAVDKFVNNGITTVRQWNREAETYILVTETSEFKIFAAYPFMSLGRQSLVYDKTFRTLRWYPEFRELVHYPQPVADAVVGLIGGQQIEIIPAEQPTPDSQFYRQKAQVLQINEFAEQVDAGQIFNGALINGAAVSEIDKIISGAEVAVSRAARAAALDYGNQLVGSGATLANQGVRAVFTGIGSAIFDGWNINTISSQPDNQYFQLSFLVEPLATFSIAGADYSSSYPKPTIDSIGNLALPAPGSNVFENPTNTPQVFWPLQLPIGAYDVTVDWIDQGASGSPGVFGISIRYGPIYSQASTLSSVTYPVNTTQYYPGVWESSTIGAVQTSSPIQLSVSDTTLKAVALTLDFDQSANGIKIVRINVTRANSTSVSQYSLQMNVNSNSGQLSIPAQYFNFAGAAGTFDVIKSDWIDASLFGNMTNIVVTLQSLTVPAIPLGVSGVDLRERFRVTHMFDGGNFAALKNTYLDLAGLSIAKVYGNAINIGAVQEFRVQDIDGTWLWVENSTNAWVAAISQLEPRINQAFRQAVPGDVGKPALVPDGLQLLADGRVKVNNTSATCLPTLQALQPWMIPLGIYVAAEDFWIVDRPPRQLNIVNT